MSENFPISFRFKIIYTHFSTYSNFNYLISFEGNFAKITFKSESRIDQCSYVFLVLYVAWLEVWEKPLPNRRVDVFESNVSIHLTVREDKTRCSKVNMLNNIHFIGIEIRVEVFKFNSTFSWISVVINFNNLQKI